MTKERISVVLPVHNEAENIRACLGGLWSTLSDHEHEILVCYDSDEDTTLAAIAAMEGKPPTVRLVKNDLGPGAAYALRAGFRAATGDVVVTTTADLPDRPGIIPAMAEKIRREGAHVVVGSRYMAGGSRSGGSWLGRFLSRAGGLSLHRVAGVGTHDATNAFRAYSGEFLKCVPAESETGFEVGLELTVKAHLGGFKVDEVPSTSVDRSDGQGLTRILARLPNYLPWYWKAMGPHFLKGGALAAVGFLIWLSLLRFPGFGVYAQKDYSWAQSLEYLAKHRFQAGKDYVFTMGPLGSFHTAAYDSGRYYLKVVWNLAITLAFPVLALAAARQMHGKGKRALLCGILVLFVPFASDAPCLLLMFLAGVLFVRHRHLPTWAEGAIVTLLAVLALVKFTFFVFSTVALAILLVATCRNRSWKSACRTLGIYAAALLLAWLLSGQSLASIPSYLRGSLELTGGYAEAMAVKGKSGELVAALVMMMLLAFTTVRHVVKARSPAQSGAPPELPAPGQSAARAASGPGAVGRDNVPGPAQSGAGLSVGRDNAPGPAQLGAGLSVGRDNAPGRESEVLTAVLLWAGVLLAWKHGFVRHDGHSIVFFVYVMAAGLLVWDRREGKRWLRAARDLSHSAILILALVGFFSAGWDHRRGIPLRPIGLIGYWGSHIAHNWRVLRSPRRYKRALQRQRESQARRYHLPVIRKVVADEPVDVISWEQGVLLLNEMNWRPRPVFQSYAAYTRWLLDRNRAFFQSGKAPAFILFKLQTIDGRFPMLDECSALGVILRDYAPVLVERGYLLLRRNPRPSVALPPSGEPVVEREARFGERVDIGGLPGECHQLSLDIRSSLLGELCKLAFRSPLVFLEIETSSGETRRYRIVPGMANSGFILNPLILTQGDLIHWYGGSPRARVTSFRVTVNPRWAWCFQDCISVRLFREDGLVPEAREKFTTRLRYSMPQPPPDQFQSPHPLKRATAHGREVLLAPPPEELRSRLPAGVHALTGQFGILPGAYLLGETDGVSFNVSTVDSSGRESVLSERYSDPLHCVTDRGLQNCAVASRTDGETEARCLRRAQTGAPSSHS